MDATIPLKDTIEVIRNSRVTSGWLRISDNCGKPAYARKNPVSGEVYAEVIYTWQKGHHGYFVFLGNVVPGSEPADGPFETPGHAKPAADRRLREAGDITFLDEKDA